MTRIGFEFEFCTHHSDEVIRSKLNDIGIKVRKVDRRRNNRNLDYKMWRLEGDPSVEPRRHLLWWNDFELISPPMQMNKALRMLDVVLRFLKENDCETNTTTGLHINMDIGKRATKRIDGTKLIVLVDEEAVAKRYSRSRALYALPRNSKIRKTAKYWKNLKKKPSSLKRYVKQRAVMEYELTEKYSAISFEKQESDGFLEFRMIGNSFYEKRYTEIKNDIRHFETCMIKAADKELGEKALTRRLNKI